MGYIFFCLLQYSNIYILISGVKFISFSHLDKPKESRSRRKIKAHKIPEMEDESWVETCQLQRGSIIQIGKNNKVILELIPS